MKILIASFERTVAIALPAYMGLSNVSPDTTFWTSEICRNMVAAGSLSPFGHGRKRPARHTHRSNVEQSGSTRERVLAERGVCADQVGVASRLEDVDKQRGERLGQAMSELVALLQDDAFERETVAIQLSRFDDGGKAGVPPSPTSWLPRPPSVQLHPRP